MTTAPMAAIASQFAAIFPQFAQSDALLPHVAHVVRIMHSGNVSPDFGAVAMNFPGMRLRETRHQAGSGECGDQNQLSHKFAPL
jgi:hypothetical protein